VEWTLPSGAFRGSALEKAAIEAFRRGGWKVFPQPNVAGVRPDLVVRRGDRQYIVEMKSAAEPRRDRLVPLLAQAILEAKAAASKANLSPPARPMAIVGAPHLPESVIDDIRSFAQKVAPDVSIGVIDPHGSRFFIGHDVEELSRLVPSSRSKSRALQSLGPKLDLFSDLNQWMLKVLLAPGIPDNLMHAPRERIQNVSDLAKVAQVSPMSASRFVSLLRAEEFLGDSRGLNLVNLESLSHRWQFANRRPIREVPMRWAIPGDPESQLSEALKEYLRKLGSEEGASRSRLLERRVLRPRVCLGLFAAADALGFKFVRGVAPHIYLEVLDEWALKSLGLLPADPQQRPDLFVRVPGFRESVFRAAVVRDGIPVCDIVQVWLDVSGHPARGASQAQEIWRRVLVPLSKRDRA
jgi:hypothetical protein